MKHIALLLFFGLAALFTAPPAKADGPVLVELFASKNCRACPKAHKTLAEVDASRDDVLILTWSVDYLDYLGGADPMALPDSAARQNAYVDRFGLRGPYTPQTVYNGTHQCPGNKPQQVERALGDVQALAPSGMALTLVEGAVTVTGPPDVSAEVMMIDYLSGTDNPTDMVHPVTQVRQIGTFSGNDLSIAIGECAHTCAIIAQGKETGPVLATLKLP